MPLSKTAQKMVDRVAGGTLPDWMNSAPAEPEPPPRTLDSAPVDSTASVPPKSEGPLGYRKDIDGRLDGWLSDDPSVVLVAVEGRPLPADASPTEKAVAQFALIVKGLMLGYDWRDPMILGREFVHTWLSDPRMKAILGLRYVPEERQLANIIKNLTRFGFLEVVGTMPIPGKPKPAYLYGLGAPAVRGPEVARLGGEQPDHHPLDDLLVSRTEFGPPVRVAETTGDDAMGDDLRGLHGPDDARSGGESPARPAPINAIGGPL